MSYALQNWLLQVTVLHVAAKHSTASAVTALIDAGAEVEAQSSFKSRPLHWAAAFNSTSVIAVLIASKSDVNAQGFLQQTPLHRAAEMNEEAVPLLLEAKANVNILDKKQRSPLFLAAKWKHEQSLILLCEAGADHNLGISPLKEPSIDDSIKALIKKHSNAWMKSMLKEIYLFSNFHYYKYCVDYSTRMCPIQPLRYVILDKRRTECYLLHAVNRIERFWNSLETQVTNQSQCSAKIFLDTSLCVLRSAHFWESSKVALCEKRRLSQTLSSGQECCSQFSHLWSQICIFHLGKHRKNWFF